MNQTKKIRWLIAHEPVELFLRTAQAFSSKLNELTNGTFEVEIYTVSEYLEKFGDKALTQTGTPGVAVFEKDVVDPFIHMEEDMLEMSQLHISELAKGFNANFFALEMPFIFRDHDHATRVLEGKIGQGLLNSLAENSPATGLAFTYSGGFRCIASEKEIKNLDDLKGCKFGTSLNPVIADMIESLGAIPETFHIRDFAKRFREEGYLSEVVDTTIPRYKAILKDSKKRNLLNTKHNLFLTTVVASNKFLDRLTDDERQAIDAAVLYASRAERTWSVQEAQEFAHADHKKIEVNYAELDQQETDKFKVLVKPLYEKYTNFFYPGLIDGIIRS